METVLIFYDTLSAREVWKRWWLGLLGIVEV